MIYLIPLFFMLVSSSLIIYLGVQLYTAMEPRARNWPAFWASALIMICALPILGLLFTQFSVFKPVINIDVAAFHAPLTQMDVMATQALNGSPVASVDIGNVLVKSVLGIYLIGLFIQLAKLFIGRRKAHHIAKHSIFIRRQNGQACWQTDILVSPFAITPLGRTEKSKIIISSHFIEALSAEELETVLAHESAHIIRRDDEMGLVLRCVLAGVWFNPIAHLFFDRWKQSAEIQCDAAVTRTHSAEMRHAYAETLIKALHITAERVRQYPTASFSNPRLRNAKMRIRRRRVNVHHRIG